MNWQDRFSALLLEYLKEEQGLDIVSIEYVPNDGWVPGCDTCDHGSGYRDMVTYRDSFGNTHQYRFEDGIANFLGWI